MAVGTKFISVPGSGGVPEDYLVSGSAAIDLLSVSAVFDGSGAGSDFLPAVQILDEADRVVATMVGDVVAAGDSREVTFAPFLGRSGAGAGGGIDFNKDNTNDASGAVGDYLQIDVDGTGVNPFGPGTISINQNSGVGSIDLTNNGDGGITITDDGAGGFYLLATGSGSNGRVRIECNGGLSSFFNNGSGLNIASSATMPDGYGMHIGAAAGIILGGTFDPLNPSDAPDRYLVIDTGEFGQILVRSDVVKNTTIDPGVPGAFWNDSGTVKISL